MNVEFQIQQGRLYYEPHTDQVWHVTRRYKCPDEPDRALYRLDDADHTRHRYVRGETLRIEDGFARLPVVVDVGESPRRWGLRDVPSAWKGEYRDTEDDQDA